MGRQWLQKNKEINAAKRGKLFTRLAREISIAAKSGLPDPAMNPRLAVTVEAARKQSVPNDVIQRAIKKGAGLLDEKIELQLVTFEGFAPHKVAVIIECMTDNQKRTAPEMRALFAGKGQLGARVSFLFHHLGIVEATHEKAGLDIEAAAIEANAQNVEPREDVPAGQTGARFFTDRADLDAAAKSLREANWSVTAAEMGYVAKEPLDLREAERKEVLEFLETIDDQDDVHRIYAALK